MKTSCSVVLELAVPLAGVVIHSSHKNIWTCLCTQIHVYIQYRVMMIMAGLEKGFD